MKDAPLSCNGLQDVTSNIILHTKLMVTEEAVKLTNPENQERPEVRNRIFISTLRHLQQMMWNALAVVRGSLNTVAFSWESVQHSQCIILQMHHTAVATSKAVTQPA